MPGHAVGRGRQRSSGYDLCGADPNRAGGATEARAAWAAEVAAAVAPLFQYDSCIIHAFALRPRSTTGWKSVRTDKTDKMTDFGPWNAFPCQATGSDRNNRKPSDGGPLDRQQRRFVPNQGVP